MSGGYMAFRVLLTGANWVGDVLGACKRALEHLGGHVQVVVTNDISARVTQLNVLEKRARAIPLIGRRWARHIQGHVNADRITDTRRRISEMIRNHKPDILLALVDGLYPVMPDLMNDSPNIIKIAWMMDDPFYYHSAALFDLHAFDVLYTVEDSLVAPLRQATGRPVSCIPLAADTTTYHKLRDPTSGDGCHDLVFVGKSYRASAPGEVRKRLLSGVIDYGLSIWGDQGWKNWTVDGADLGQCYRGGPTQPEETNRIYNHAKVVINILHPQIRSGTSLRTFSICAAGAFQLVEWREGLYTMLEPGREIVAYRCGDELKEQAEHYLLDERARRRIAAAGYSRVAAEHTYVHRLCRIVTDAGIGASTDSRIAVSRARTLQ